MKFVVKVPEGMAGEIRAEADDLDMLPGEYLRDILRGREKIAKYDFAVGNDLLDEEKLDEEIEDTADEEGEEEAEEAEGAAEKTEGAPEGADEDEDEDEDDED